MTQKSSAKVAARRLQKHTNLPYATCLDLVLGKVHFAPKSLACIVQEGLVLVGEPPLTAHTKQRTCQCPRCDPDE